MPDQQTFLHCHHQRFCQDFIVFGHFQIFPHIILHQRDFPCVYICMKEACLSAIEDIGSVFAVMTFHLIIKSPFFCLSLKFIYEGLPLLYQNKNCRLSYNPRTITFNHQIIFYQATDFAKLIKGMPEFLTLNEYIAAGTLMQGLK